MKLYLIAPLPDFGHNANASSRMLNIGESYALMASAGITTVAALLGDDVDLRLCDEMIEEVDFDVDCDVVAISMNVGQAARGLDIARRFREMGRTIVVGGPHVSLSPETFADAADCLVIGEFETVAEQFRADLKAGTLKARYRCGQADLAAAPMPRWDLYRNDRALTGVIQTSRGCPFECNFCDVIQYLGRVQRHKPVDKVVAEAQQLYDLGYRSINLSDDNFTVNRRKSRAMLDGLAAWNGREGRAPVEFATQCSIDLSRDADLIEMCRQAGLREVFIGIETSSEEALKESQKRQNLRQDLVETVSRIVSGGLVVTLGMMVGFDSDDATCFERQFDFGMSLPVVNLRPTVLVAPIGTPLHAQMQAEGRLYDDDLSVFPGGGLLTNFRPAKMSREELADGARWLVEALYAPDNAIARFEHLARLLRPAPDHLVRAHETLAPGKGAAGVLKLLRQSARDPGARRVIDAVNDLSHQRPEIARDLSTILAGYLNTYSTQSGFVGQPGRAAPPALASAIA
ncbi:radical SAM protein [Pararhodobacter marinus]|uniref:Radical SAM protein n=1 Tax=Pararhodobacter marinus TaxID=2184063 RepID=A0A2U2CFY3_9RHOB|nr:radical SAM protein [Pararhodobacter marinus]PWE30796.1 radical SAM protein [Pararhodobacter marinus]